MLFSKIVPISSKLYWVLNNQTNARDCENNIRISSIKIHLYRRFQEKNISEKLLSFDFKTKVRVSS